MKVNMSGSWASVGRRSSMICWALRLRLSRGASSGNMAALFMEVLGPPTPTTPMNLNTSGSAMKMRPTLSTRSFMVSKEALCSAMPKA